MLICISRCITSVVDCHGIAEFHSWRRRPHGGFDLRCRDQLAASEQPRPVRQLPYGQRRLYQRLFGVYVLLRR